MVIEECNAINYLISNVLKKDFNVTSAFNSADAMHKLRTDLEKDLIIMDISSTDSDNFELLEHISSSSVLSNIQRVVISDSDDEQLKNKTTALGASLFVTKPFDPLYLSEKVNALVSLNEKSIVRKRKFSFNMNIF
ncbi:MAG: response regulator [Ferruginibacter sp.]